MNLSQTRLFKGKVGKVTGTSYLLGNLDVTPNEVLPSYPPTGTIHVIDPLIVTSHGNAPEINPYGGLLSFNPFSNNPEEIENVIQLKHAPLTKGWGDAQLAGVEDVEVHVNGVLQPSSKIAKVIPTLGRIILKDPVLSGSTVTVKYHYTPNPTLTLKPSDPTDLPEWEVLDSLAHTFNNTNKPFPFNFVLGHDEKVPQPLQRGYRYTALHHAYSATLNDPTSLLFNEPTHLTALLPMGRSIAAKNIFYEATSAPAGKWSSVGTAPQFPSFQEDLFIIEDTSVSDDLVASEPLYYKQHVDITYDHYANINLRLKAYSYQSDGDFTGIGFGYSSDKALHFVGLLDIHGFKTAGILTDRGDESEWQSYNGIQVNVVPRDVNGNLQNDRLQLNFQPSLAYDDRVFIEGAVYKVDKIQGGNVWGIYEVILQSELPSSIQGNAQVFLEVQIDKLSSYRFVKDPAGDLAVYVEGSIAQIASANESEMPFPKEVFELLDINEVFFGSISRKAANRSGWAFARYNINPINTEEIATQISITQPFHNYPEKDLTDPWTVIDDQGFSNLLNNRLIIEQAGRKNIGTYNYARVEPFHTSQNISSLKAVFRVNSYVDGIPAFVSLVDDRKEITIGVFEGGITTKSVVDAASYLVTDGNYPIDDPSWVGTSKSTGGAIIPDITAPVAGGNITVPKYKLNYSGSQSFADEGWTEDFTNVTSSYTDRYHTIKKGQGTVANAFVTHPNLTAYYHENLAFSARLRFNSGTTNANRLISPIIGITDTKQNIRIGFYDDGTTSKVVFVEANNNPILDSNGDILGADFNWNDGKFHTYRVNRGAVITLLVDGESLAGSYSLLHFETTNTPSDIVYSLDLGTQSVDFDLDYMFSHSLNQEGQFVGLFMGGDVNNPNSYVKIQKSWLKTDLTVEIERDPTGQAVVYLNGSEAFREEYLNLPDRTNHVGMNTKHGYVQFGCMDPETYSFSSWDLIQYLIRDGRADRKTLPFSYFNNGNVVTSSEPVYDEYPEVRDVVADTNSRVYLNSKGIYVNQMLRVTSLDGTQQYAFTYHSEINELEIHGHTLIPRITYLRINYIAKHPFGWDYLLNNGPENLLNDTTPPFPLSYQNNWTIGREPIDPNNPNGPEKTVFKYDFNARFEDLDLRIENVRGDAGLLAPACDDLGFREITFSMDPSDPASWPWQDTYTMPSTSNVIGCFPKRFHLEGHNILGATGYQLSYLDKTDTVLDATGCVGEVKVQVEWLIEEDVYEDTAQEEILDEIIGADLTLYSGFVLDNSKLDEESFIYIPANGIDPPITVTTFMDQYDPITLNITNSLP